MKTLWNQICSRPWLLVIVAFCLLITAWVSIITISVRYPAERLSPAQEQVLLENQKRAPTP